MKHHRVSTQNVGSEVKGITFTTVRFQTRKHKKNVLEQYGKTNKARYEVKDKKGVQTEEITHLSTSTRSYIFNPLPANETIEFDIIAGLGVDANFISRQLLAQVFEG